jgi:hypothetical protein
MAEIVVDALVHVNTFYSDASLPTVLKGERGDLDRPQLLDSIDIF